jgi:hypothetical protein
LNLPRSACVATRRLLFGDGPASLHAPEHSILTFNRSPIRVAICFAIALVAGCQSGVQRDVVERELRQQEDQIYSLQDYLSEYQQLLCDARRENAALKRQLVQGQFQEDGTGELPEPTKSLTAPRSAAPTSSSPSATPPTPPPGTSAPSGNSTIVPPEVPPLDLSTPTEPTPQEPTPQDQSALEGKRAGEVEQASAEIEVVEEPPTAVVLRGEVRLDNTAGGPRVLVDVEPVTAEGRLTDFRGNLSLLVLDPAARDPEQQLARWDFRPADLQALAKRTKRGTAYEFPLQLPADAPASRPLELWVRLVPEDGRKLLARTTLDVSRPGQFASAEAPGAVEQPALVASANPKPTPHRASSRHFDADVRQSGWQTAKPGDRPQPAAAAVSTAEWKVATQPVPEVESTPVVTKPLTASAASQQGGERYGKSSPPEWSPERADDGNSTPSSEPAWSPTR